jgi:hypothetical protein
VSYTPGADLDKQDFHLEESSPAIDVGYDAFSPAEDFDGITRPIDGDGDGTRTCDAGAYE